jgi:hypothetical protein
MLTKSHNSLDFGDGASKLAGMKRSLGTPAILSASGPPKVFERIQLGDGNYNEAWLQQLIFDRPGLIPVAQIEPAFGELVAVAREVPCGHGFIDNLYVTPAGEIVLVETKLWRNVQARREVVAQALDYVAALMGISFESFEAAVGAGEGFIAESLYALVAGRPGALAEAHFIDAVATNLGRGRMLVIALGDGIRKEAEALASLLQSHAGAHFTFALVELATWLNPATGDILVVPNTLAQTIMIERGIVIVQNGQATVLPMPPAQIAKAQSISEAMFYEEIARRDPALPQAIKAFLAEVEPLGVYADLKASLNLKIDLGDAPRSHNLGYIAKNGQLWTHPLAATVPEPLALRYNETLAALIGGRVATHSGIYLSTNGKSAPMVGELVPTHAREWIEAIRVLVVELSERQAEQPG